MGLLADIDATRERADRWELLRDCVGRRGPGLVLEFGVAYGESMRVIAGEVPEVWGFDTFTGMPEEWWEGGERKLRVGDFDCGGVPKEGPRNARYVVGRFEDTLPGFVAEHPEPWGFVHVDSDLESSCRTILRHANAVPGTVMLFDEMYGFGQPWGELRAFEDWGRPYRVVGRYMDKVGLVLT